MFVNLGNLFARLRRDRKGAALVEYAMLVGGIALICLVAVSILGHKTNDMLAATAAILPGAHVDDNGPLVSGKLAETTQGANGAIVLDVNTIAAGGPRLSKNLGTDLSTLVVEP